MQDSLPSYSKFLFLYVKKNIHNNYEYETIIGSISSINKVSYYQINDFRLKLNCVSLWW